MSTHTRNKGDLGCGSFMAPPTSFGRLCQAALTAGRAIVQPAVASMSHYRHRHRTDRRLEIGPGEHRIAGFETVSIRAGRNVDYVADAATRLPFAGGTFELIYASHVLEHIPWYQTTSALREWVRVLRLGGRLEVWVPDGLKIAEAFVAAERSGDRSFEQDRWWRFNDHRDPCRWASGRTFSYGDGTGRANDPNWHRALFSPRYLAACLEVAGLVDIRLLDRSEVRGHDHGWINLGMTGAKPG